jgi:hypothetical protein
MMTGSVMIGTRRLFARLLLVAAALLPGCAPPASSTAAPAATDSHPLDVDPRLRQGGAR